MSAPWGEFEGAAHELARRLDAAVEERVRGESMVAVAFSGGLDSSVVARCASNHTRVVACSAFTLGSRDEEKAPEAAKELGVELRVTRLTREIIEKELGAMEVPFEPTLMDRSLWCLYRVVSRSAGEAGARVMLLGQLADELFGGYAKYSETLEQDGPEEAKEMMEADFRDYAQRGRLRDLGACRPSVEARFPFEAKPVVELAASIPVSFKVRDGVRKAVLRRAAAALGVPERLANGAKKAGQYSSGVQKLVASLHF